MLSSLNSSQPISDEVYAHTDQAELNRIKSYTGENSSDSLTDAEEFGDMLADFGINVNVERGE